MPWQMTLVFLSIRMLMKNPEFSIEDDFEVHALCREHHKFEFNAGPNGPERVCELGERGDDLFCRICQIRRRDQIHVGFFEYLSAFFHLSTLKSHDQRDGEAD